MTSPHAPRRPDPALLEGLRARIRRIEHPAAAGGADTPAAVSLGAAPIDAALPWRGLPRGALHEVTGSPLDGAAAGFCAALMVRLAGPRGTVLWCTPRRGLYGPGLLGLGLDPARLIVVRPRNAADLLWAMEEALRSGGPAAVLGEIDDLAPTAARRLQLAAEHGGVAALLLRPASKSTTPLPATTRWRLSPAPPRTGPDLWEAPRWRAELLRCRGGRPAEWRVEWHLAESGDGTTGGFAVAAEPGHRPAAPALVGVAANGA